MKVNTKQNTKRKYQQIFGQNFYKEITLEKDSNSIYEDYDYYMKNYYSDYISDSTTICASTFDLSADNTITLDSNILTSGSIGINEYDYIYTSEKSKLRNNGKIPLDIWAKMYNNGLLE